MAWLKRAALLCSLLASAVILIDSSDSELDDDIADFVASAALVVGAMVAGKRKRSCWIKPEFVKRKEQSEYFTLLQDYRNDPSGKNFHRKMRMSPELFDELLVIVGPHITKHSLREPISAGERLALTLRYLISGSTMGDIADDYHVSHQSAYAIINETLDVIYEQLSKKYMTAPRTTDEWKIVADRCFARWQCPNCVGALDGKHVHICKPKGSGSLYFNYKHRHSTNLMALVDADYCFNFIDVGQYGKENDSTVFKESIFGKVFEAGKHAFQTVFRKLPHSTVDFPFFIVADDAFQLSRNMMKPFAGGGLTKEQQLCNYRISRMRRCVENAFGLLRARFRIFATEILAKPPLVDKIVLASCALHNFLMKKKVVDYCADNDLDIEGADGSELPGQWRNEVLPEDYLGNGWVDDEGNVLRHGSNHSSNDARNLRDKLAEYFNSPIGHAQCPWQSAYVDAGRMW